MGATASGYETHLRERATQLTQLEQIQRDAQGGRGRVVFLTGPVGVGKTFLARIFMEEAYAADPRLLALSVTCLEGVGALRPYGPFRDLLDRLSAVASEIGLEGIVAQEAPGWEPGGHPPPSRHGLFDEFVGVWRTVGAQRPTVLFVDDFQWSDHSSLDLLARIGGVVASVPMLVIVAFDAQMSGDDEGDGEPLAVESVQRRLGPNAVELVLREFEDRAAGELAEDLLGGSVASELVEWLAAVAGGNPLHLEQLVRWLRARNAIRRRLFRYTLAEEIPAAETPGIEEAVAGRLEALVPSMRWTLEAASMSAGLIDSAIVAGQVGKAEGEIAEQLTEAETVHGFLAAAGRGRWPGRASRRFEFRHPIFRRILRSGVPDKRRLRLVQRAAEGQEELAGAGAARIADELVILYRQAGDLRKSHEWALDAADMAERLYAPHEAENLIRTAARTGRDEIERIQLQYRLAKLYSTTGREIDAEKLLESAFERSRELDDRATEVRTGVLLGWLQLERGVQPSRLAALSGHLVDGARQSGLAAELVSALDLACVVAERLGRAEEALLMAEEALHVADGSGELELVARSAYRLARVHMSFGNPEEGRTLAERALEAFEERGAVSGVTECHHLLGVADFRAGDWGSALQHWGSALERLEFAGLPDQKLGMQANIAELATLRGDFKRARELFETGLELARELDEPPQVLRCLFGLARLAFEQGDYADVLERTEKVRAVLPESGAWKENFRTTAIRALAYLELGDEVQAWHEAARLEQLYQGKEGWFEGRAEGDAVRMRVIDLDSDAWLAGMVADQGIGETADKDPYGEAFLQYHRAFVTARSNAADARKACERAVDLFSELGAVPMLERAEALLAELPEAEPAVETAESDDEITEDKIDQWFDSLEG